MSAECGASSPHIQELMTMSFKCSDFGQCLQRTKSIVIKHYIQESILLLKTTI